MNEWFKLPPDKMQDLPEPGSLMIAKNTCTGFTQTFTPEEIWLGSEEYSIIKNDAVMFLGEHRYFSGEESYYSLQVFHKSKRVNICTKHQSEVERHGLDWFGELTYYFDLY